MYDMLHWAKELFPIPRSLTGDGVRETFHYLKSINNEINIKSFPTGMQVFDWEIPYEWKINNSYIEHIETGKHYAKFSENNLHVVGYSTPIDEVMDKHILCKNIYTEPSQPDLIPYVTSYYKNNWGFCMSETEKAALPDGKYRAFIDSKLFDGELLIGDAIFKGKLNKEIMFSSYICHPSMANNELSGPVLISALMKYIKDSFSNLKFTYRFILVPETIGSLAYMSQNLNQMKENVVCGFNLSCVGDERSFSHIQSRYGKNISDLALKSALIDKENVKSYSFLDRGSDERQYCAPGIDLPICGFCRTKYGEFPEYHTNADNFDLVTSKGLDDSFKVMKTIIDTFEFGLYPKVRIRGEPQLGKRGLYPEISRKGIYSEIKIRMNFLAYSDGTNSLFDISNIISEPLDNVLKEARILFENNLISLSDEPK
jgi:aminopeptidase-like protein